MIGCAYDTNGDGDCHICNRHPERCLEYVRIELEADDEEAEMIEALLEFEERHYG